MKLKYILFISVIFLAGNLCRSYAAEEVLSWIDCVREAAKNHPDLIAAIEEVKQSQATKQETASALFPQISSSASAQTAKTAANPNSGAPDTFSYGVTGSQLIFDGTKTINEVRAAAENVSASKENFKFTSVTVRFRLRSAFIDLLRAQEMLRITQEIYDIRRGNLELISLRYESGLEHKGALLTAEADLAEAKYGIAAAQRNLKVAQEELTKEMGRDKLVSMRVKGDFKIKDSSVENLDFDSLVRNNPSLQQIMAQKRSAEFSLRSAYANFSPELTGSAGANRTGSRWTPRGDQWNLGVTLTMPLFEGGLRMAQVSGAQALVRQLQENERSTRDGIILSLRQTWALLQDAVDNVGVQEKMLTAATERSKIAQVQYSIGFVSFDNWTIIEDNLVGAKRAYINAQADALLAEAEWVQAKGEILEYD